MVEFSQSIKFYASTFHTSKKNMAQSALHNKKQSPPHPDLHPSIHTHTQTHTWVTQSLKHVSEFRRARSENIITGRRLHWTPLAAQSQGVYTWAHTAQLATDHRPQKAPTEILEKKKQKLTCLDGFRDHVCSFDGVGWLGVKQRTRRTFFWASALIHSASERVWAVAHGSSSEHSDGRGQVEGSQGIVLWSATDIEIFCDCLWARSINCDSRCTMFLSFTANWFSSVS